MLRTLILALGLAITLAACGAPEPDANKELADRVRALEDEREIRRIADALDDAVDAKNWEAVRALFTDEVAADFTTLGAGQSGAVFADHLIESWRRNLHAGKISTRSRDSEVVTVTGDTATMISQGHIRYEIPARTTHNVWEGWGRFEHTFTRTPDGWRVSGFKFTLEREAGEQSVRLETAPAEPSGITQAD